MLNKINNNQMVKLLKMKYLFCIILMHVPVKFFAQDYNTRLVVITSKDSIIQANVLNKKKEIEPKPELFYFWYIPEVVQANKGGFHGLLLHGEYTVLNHHKTLVMKGYFEEGLKVGPWKRWHANGQLKSFSQFRDGVKDGEEYFYNKEGKLIKTLHYKDGMLHGDYLIHGNDTIITVNYHKGEAQEEVPAGVKNNFFIEWYRQLFKREGDKGSNP